MSAAPSDPSIELLYFTGCPNHDAFLPHLRSLLRNAGINVAVQTLEITNADDAHREHFLGSPTLRINGVDVDVAARERTDYGMQCRLYLTEQGTRGTPPDSWILQALAGGASSSRHGGANPG